MRILWGYKIIIDSHVHLKHGDINRTEYSPEEIVKIMDYVGIDKSVVFAMSTTTNQSIKMALEAVRKFPNKLIPYVYALPSFKENVLSKIENVITEYNFKGIKIHRGECILTEYMIDPVIKLAGELDVPCLIDCIGRYKDIDRIAKTFPNTIIIVAHMGKYLCKDPNLIGKFIDLALKYENIYLDISGVVLIEKIVDATNILGADRLIFGTDGPHRDPTTIDFAKKELEKIKKLPLSQEDKEWILGRTISKILKL